MKFKKCSPNLIGLLQSLGVIIYCTLLGGFFWTMGKINPGMPGISGIVLMLFLLVFSAGITGLLVFGYPAYLAINNKIKEALTILTYTFLYSLLIILIVLFFVFI